MKKSLLIISMALSFIFVMSGFFSGSIVYGEENIVEFIKKKREELDEREKKIKVDEERLTALQSDVDEKIKKYSSLLTQIDEILTELKRVKDKKELERLMKVVKSYEKMPFEEAAERLSALDEYIAVDILLNMSTRKAGPIIGLMETGKAVSLTRKMTKAVKKIPKP